MEEQQRFTGEEKRAIARIVAKHPKQIIHAKSIVLSEFVFMLRLAHSDVFSVLSDPRDLPESHSSVCKTDRA